MDDEILRYECLYQFSESPTATLLRAKHIVPVLAIAELITAASTWLPASFLPHQARVVANISLMWIGAVFAILPITAIIARPIVKLAAEEYSLRFTLVTGLCLQAASLFGLALLEASSSYFLIMALIFRSSQGVALSAISSAGMTFIIASRSSPDDKAGIANLLERCATIGMLFGTPIGGFLFSTFGFATPFFVAGSGSLVVAIIACFVFPGSVSRNQQLVRERSKIREVLLEPRVPLFLIGILVAESCVAFLEPTLGYHLREFNMESWQLGTLFAIASFSYVITSMLMSYRIKAEIMMVLGLVVSGISFLILSNDIVFDHTTAVGTIIAIACLGAGAGCTLSPAVAGVLRETHHLGVESVESVAQLAALARIAGDFVGPAVGATLVQSTSFHIGTLIYCLFCVLLSLVTLLVAFCQDESVGRYPPTSTHREVEIRIGRARERRLESALVES